MTIKEKATSGLPLTDCFIVDAHMHNARVAPFFSRFDHYSDLIRQMDAIGINCGIASNLWETGKVWERHPEIIRMAEEYPGRLYGYIAPDPHRDNYKTEFEKYANNPVFVGVKLHPVVHHMDLLCVEYRYAYSFAADHGFPVLIHTWGIKDIKEFCKVAEEYPKTTLLIGHSGGEEDAIEEAIHLAGGNENVYLDITSTYCWQGSIEAMVKGATAEKVLYGSDAYWNSMEASVGRVAFADISESEKKLILGENARRIFHLSYA